MEAPFALQNKPVTLYHRRHSRRNRGKALSHLVPAAVLLVSALGAFTEARPITALMWAEMAVGVAYLGLMVRELRHLRHDHPHHERIAWLELAAAGILVLEGYHIWHRHHEAEAASGVHHFHVLPWLYWLIAGWYVLLAFGVVRVLERRHLHLHAEGFRGRLTLWGKPFNYRWAEVASLEPVEEADVIIHHSDGQTHRMSFAALHDGPAYRDRLVAHAANRISA